MSQGFSISHSGNTVCVLVFAKKAGAGREVKGCRFKIESFCSKETAGELTCSLHPWQPEYTQLCLGHKSKDKKYKRPVLFPKAFPLQSL